MHIGRTELIEASTGGLTLDAEQLKHVAGCEYCSEMRLIFESFPVFGKVPFAQPPDSWLTKAIGLAKESGGSISENISSIIRELVGIPTFDSWDLLAHAGVRGEAIADERRMRFEADGCLLELRSEKVDVGWEFVAQVYVDGTASDKFVAQIDDLEIRSSADKFYQWSSKKPPSSIKLLSDELIILFEDISWK